MASEQSLIQVIIQAAVETAKTAVMAVREAEGPTKSRTAVQATPSTSGPTVRQPIFIERCNISIMNGTISKLK